MQTQAYINFYLDTRRKKANGKYPVKLRVFTTSPRKQVLYPTAFDLSEAEYKNTIETLKPRNEYKELRRKLEAVKAKAEEVAEKLQPFSFEAFEKKLYRKAGEGANVFWHYAQAIEAYKQADQFGTASNYELSMKSLKGYMTHMNGKQTQKLLFSDVTSKWLEGYERYMIKELGRTRTTVSFYVRALRTIFNNAVKSNDIEPGLYPFGKGAYQPPAVHRVKKVLGKEQLNILLNAKANTPEQEKAKDLWFFSYCCNGMNIKDVANLRYEDISEGAIRFFRAKTINTSKDNLREGITYLNAFTGKVIEKYGNEQKSPRNYVFPFLNDSMSAAEKRIKVQNLTRFINQNLKKLAIGEGLPGDISTYWARHSFATVSLRNGFSMEFISEALLHSDLKTTKGYLAGFEDDVKKEFANSLLNF